MTSLFHDNVWWEIPKERALQIYSYSMSKPKDEVEKAKKKCWSFIRNRYKRRYARSKGLRAYPLKNIYIWIIYNLLRMCGL